MKKLGANAIRVYHVNNGDHKGCMTALANAGVYLFVDLDTFTSDIDQYHPQWTRPQEKAFQAVMDEFQQYENTAGFFIANEVITRGNHSYVAPYVKASVRDLKTYRNSKGYRQIPIGYSHADITDLRPSLQNYFACGPTPTTRLDFFGLNAYEWCGDNTYAGSGYANLTAQIQIYPIPILISETGCNTAPPRTFQDQAAIFGPEMSGHWSGAVVYEWLQEANHYGLVSYEGDTDALVTRVTGSFASKGTPRPVTPDFGNLMRAWESARPVGVQSEAYTPMGIVPDCPEYTEGSWEVDEDVVLPSLGEKFDSAVEFSITAGHAPTGGEASGAAAEATSGMASRSGNGAAGMRVGHYGWGVSGSVVSGFAAVSVVAMVGLTW